VVVATAMAAVAVVGMTDACNRFAGLCSGYGFCPVFISRCLAVLAAMDIDEGLGGSEATPCERLAVYGQR